MKQVEALKVKSPRQRELALKWIRFDIKDVITRRNTAIKNRRKLEYEIVAAPRRFNFFPHNSSTLKCSPTFLRRTRIIGLNYVSRLKCLNLNCWIIFRPDFSGRFAITDILAEWKMERHFTTGGEKLLGHISIKLLL